MAEREKKNHRKKAELAVRRGQKKKPRVGSCHRSVTKGRRLVLVSVEEKRGTQKEAHDARSAAERQITCSLARFV